MRWLDVVIRSSDEPGAGANDGNYGLRPSKGGTGTSAWDLDVSSLHWGCLYLVESENGKCEVCDVWWWIVLEGLQVVKFYCCLGSALGKTL